MSLLLAPVLQLNAPAISGLDRLLYALGVPDAQALDQKVTDLLRRSGQGADLAAWGVKPDDLLRLAALGITKGRADNNPVDLSPETILPMLEQIYQKA